MHHGRGKIEPGGGWLKGGTCPEGGEKSAIRYNVTCEKEAVRI